MPINNLTFRNVSLAGDKGADIANSDAIIFEKRPHRRQNRRRLTTTAITNSKLEVAR
ncbi:MAG: hypothetical protein QM760_17550 [Nibricoccus sp.]